MMMITCVCIKFRTYSLACLQNNTIIYLLSPNFTTDFISILCDLTWASLLIKDKTCLSKMYHFQVLARIEVFWQCTWFSHPSRQMTGWHLEKRNNHFLPHSFHFTVYYYLANLFHVS
jgi:hypothetical protein